MFDSLLFLYFFTLHADQLNITLGGFSLRLNNLLALTLLFLFVSRYQEKLWRIDRKLFIAFLMLTASITISFFLSPYKKRCCFFLGWYGFTVLMYFLLPYLLIRYYDYKKVISLYLVSFFCVGLYALFQLLISLVGLKEPFASQFVSGAIVRPNAFAYEPSFYALYMTPFIVMVNYHFLADREQPFFMFGKLTYPKILFIDFLYFVSTSTSTFFAFAIFCMSLVFFAQVRRHLLKFCIAFTCLFFLLGIASPFIMRTFFLKFFFSGFMSHHSFYERWTGIENAWKIFQSHPYFGIGLGAYPPYLYDAFLTGNAYLNLRDTLVFSEALKPLKYFEPTNVFTEILASVGMIGALSFIGVLFVFIARVKQAIKIDRTMGCSLLLSVIVMIIVLQINQGVFRTYVWAHLAFAFALVEKIVHDTTPLFVQDPSQEGETLAQEQLA